MPATGARSGGREATGGVPNDKRRGQAWAHTAKSESELGGLREARKTFRHFQQHVLDNVTAVRVDSVPTKPRARPNPFNPADWSQPLSLC